MNCLGDDCYEILGEDGIWFFLLNSPAGRNNGGETLIKLGDTRYWRSDGGRQTGGSR